MKDLWRVPSNIFAQETNRLIDEAKNQDKPFFIWSNFWGPHSPSIVPEPYYSMYDPKSIPGHPSYCETFEDKPYGYYLSEKMWGLGNYGWAGFQEIIARYYGHCTMIDDLVGMIVDKLKEAGLYEDTIIIYGADHGDCLGAHKLIEKGAFTFDEIYRVPLVVKGAGTQDNDSLVTLQELMPTILDIAGAKLKKPVDGESLLPLMNGEKKSNGREHIFCEYHNHFYVARQRMVRDLDYQFTFNESERGELYDLKKDPYQLHNVCYDPAYKDIKKKYMDIIRQESGSTGLKSFIEHVAVLCDRFCFFCRGDSDSGKVRNQKNRFFHCYCNSYRGGIGFFLDHGNGSGITKTNLCH